MVSNILGNDQFETEEDPLFFLLVYKYHHFYVNFFLHVMKLIKKERIDEKTVKIYDLAVSSYLRVLASQFMAFFHKPILSLLYVKLIPISLRELV